MPHEIRVECGYPVGANRCRLPPHATGRHDVAPDAVLDGPRDVVVSQHPMGAIVRAAVDQSITNGHMFMPVTEEMLADTVEPDPIARLAAMPTCPATLRKCSCQTGERCSPDVHRANGDRGSIGP